MGQMRDLFTKVFFFSRVQTQLVFRRHSAIAFMFFLLGFTTYFLFLGVLIVIGFIVSQERDFQPPFAYRDLLAFGWLVLFTTFLSYLIFAGATGVRNPFIRGRQDAHFFQRVPVKSVVMYLSARLSESLMIIILLTPLVLAVLGPLMLVLHLPWWRIVIVLIVCLLTVNLGGKIGDLAFIALRRLRIKKNWVSIWFEAANPIMAVVFLWAPLLAILMVQQHFVPDFETLSNYILIPLINSAVAATGLFFRSGVPWESWMALTILFVESSAISIGISLLAARYKPMEDITEIVPVLSFQAAQIEDFIGGKTIEPPELTNEDITGEAVFSGKSPWRAYLLKDWLAIKRIRAFRKHIYRAPIIVSLITIAILFIPKENTFLIPLLYIVVFLMADFSLLLIQLEIKDPMQRFPVGRQDMIMSKFLIALMGTGFYSIPLLVVKGSISLLIIILISGLSIILGKTRLINSKLTRYFILMMIAFLTVPLLLLF